MFAFHQAGKNTDRTCVMLCWLYSCIVPQKFDRPFVWPFFKMLSYFYLFLILTLLSGHKKKKVSVHNLFTIAMSKSQGITKKNGTPNIHTCQAHTNTVQSRHSHSTLYNCNFSTSTLHKLAGGPQNNLRYTKNTSEIHTSGMHEYSTE